MELLKPEEERELVQRLYARDEVAMALFYQKYRQALRLTIWRIVRQDDLTEDVLQECMLKCWVAFPTYDASRGRLFTWASNIGQNLAIDLLRKQRRRALRTLTLSEELATTQVALTTFHPEHIGVREWVALLLPTDQQLIDLLYFQGYTQVETAEELQVPLGTVKSRSRRIIRMLSRIVT
ncbi:RNA polymerase sigma factor (plasmid) [Hymenobacter sp. BRD128]|uniref:RNA polymerase sigma factor n=1 Tax=Hymenobacter sp. BRD128 TaxID=2675878 RepID=UPI001564EAF0|nr:RNA polymerase sigma factor [Hymenobacter sp. BRD128]QKG59167.1 RNA polymerase sigma factor [Hymenobacter sp. BRD128]